MLLRFIFPPFTDRGLPGFKQSAQPVCTEFPDSHQLLRDQALGDEQNVPAERGQGAAVGGKPGPPHHEPAPQRGERGADGDAPEVRGHPTSLGRRGNPAAHSPRAELVRPVPSGHRALVSADAHQLPILGRKEQRGSQGKNENYGAAL